MQNKKGRTITFRVDESVAEGSVGNAMILNKSRILAVLLMVIVAVSVRAEDAKEVVIASAEELKGIKAKKITWKKDDAKMVLIPESFARTKDTYTEFGDLVSGKVVKVTDAFYMDTTEVTVGQFKKFLKSSGYKPKEPINWAELYKYSSNDKHPMIYVTWHDATAYAKWVGKRLPTEAEWEFATRGGLVGKVFPWGDDKAVARDYANYDGIGGRDKWTYCAPVGSFKHNGYGLYDMSGNVREWCQDGYDDYSSRVLRGGSWNFIASFLRVAGRNGISPTITNFNLGFRCVSGFPAAQQ